MRVAVCDMLEGKVPCPEALWLVTMQLLLSFNIHMVTSVCMYMYGQYCAVVLGSLLVLVLILS